MQTEEKNMLQQTKKPEIIVFAGPNGSGKSTVTKLAKIIEPYMFRKPKLFHAMKNV